MKEKKLKPKRRRKRDGPTPFQINLSRLIEERGLTYAGIAEITGLSQSTVFGWANGASPIQIDAIHRLSKALKIDFQ
ncbi:MAG: helix-turn-helix transcriptional regulator [Bdellovibrionales bacterium]|nr:helix-turn-helix transcriptional regulator [Bdellovibrionales bacterium]